MTRSVLRRPAVAHSAPLVGSQVPQHPVHLQGETFAGINAPDAPGGIARPARRLPAAIVRPRGGVGGTGVQPSTGGDPGCVRIRRAVVLAAVAGVRGSESAARRLTLNEARTGYPGTGCGYKFRRIGIELGL